MNDVTPNNDILKKAGLHKPEPVPSPRSEGLTSLLEEAATLIVEAAQHRLTVAQNDLAQEKARAERIRQVSRTIQRAVGG